MKLTPLVFFSAISTLATDASVVASWTTTDIGAARAWIASIESEGGSPGRGGKIYSTIEEVPNFTNSLVGQLMVGGEVGSLAIFGVDHIPRSFNLVFLNPLFNAPSSLVSGVASDFNVEEADPSDPPSSLRYTYSGTFNLQPGEWRLFGVADSLVLNVLAEDGSYESIPFHLLPVPEPTSAVLCLMGTVCLLRRSRRNGEQDRPESISLKEEFKKSDILDAEGHIGPHNGAASRPSDH